MRIIPLLLLILCSQTSSASPELRLADKIRIKEAFFIATHVGDQVWSDMHKTPFIILFVTDSTEFLINHPKPSADFVSTGIDTILNTEIFTRPRQFQTWFLATFPAVNGIACIVVGTPENTNRTSSEWVITLLHEHFHQLQFSQPDYYENVNKLDLANGDESGMWQLNYLFPYDSINVTAQFSRYTAALANAIDARGSKTFKPAMKIFARERQRFLSLLKPADQRYFCFQIWQEGIARYTEYKHLEFLINYQPTPAMQTLYDFVPFAKLKDTLFITETAQLRSPKLSTDKRVAFYAAGFAEGLLLDNISPRWRDEYFTAPFFSQTSLTFQ